jgi:hypothetical protein
VTSHFRSSTSSCFAWRDLLEAASPADRSALGLRSARIASGFAMAADGHESLLQNRVLGAGAPRALTDSVLEEAIAFYPDGKSFALNLCPFAELTGPSAQLLRPRVRHVLPSPQVGA